MKPIYKITSKRRTQYEPQTQSQSFLSILSPSIIFLHNYIEFHLMWTWCQIILINFLLLISNKYPVLAEHFPLPYLLSIHNPLSISLSLCYSVDGLHKEEVMIYIKRRGVTMMVVIHSEQRGEPMQVVSHSEERGDMMTEYRCDIIVMVVVPTHLLITRNELSLWLLFPFYDQEVHQPYL